MVFTFGPTGSFGYCSAGPAEQRKLGWWSNWGNSEAPSGNAVDPEEVRRQLQDRHGSWHDPVIRNIIKAMTTDCIYPIWTTPELPYWGKSGAVLLGDAAHTLQATSGQGAAQALEDSVTFSLLLTHYLATAENPDTILSENQAIQGAIQGLYEIRNPRVTAIKARARNLYLSRKRITNVVVEYLYYGMIYLWTAFPLLGEFSVCPRLFSSARILNHHHLREPGYRQCLQRNRGLAGQATS